MVSVGASPAGWIAASVVVGKVLVCVLGGMMTAGWYDDCGCWWLRSYGG